jgi:hypothetical protein
MNISSVEASFFKYLYENLEVLSGIKIFENVYYVDFETYDKWLVIDSLTHTTGAVPKAHYFLHISLKQGLQNEKVVLEKLVDQVVALVNEGVRFDVFDSETATLIGECEVCETSLTPVWQHAGGGSYRSLSVGLVYAGDALA